MTIKIKLLYLHHEMEKRTWQSPLFSYYIMDKLTQLKEIIAKEITDYFQNTNLFLVDVKVLSNGKIEIYADGNTANITIDECVQISRHIYHFLEEKNLMNDNISLDVSSPGMDEAFKVPQQYQKQLNKAVDVVLKNGMKISGELVAANENEIKIKEVIKIKKTTNIEEHTISFDEIKSVKKQFNFKL